jgi:RHS repeat-associated protein
MTDAMGSYWDYQYDELGQVISGKRYWSDGTPMAGQQFEYGFDDIGNRTSTKAGGDGIGGNLRSAAYSANSLNQYTSRTVPSAVDILGIARASADVTVNEDSAYRYREYYQHQLDIDNGSGPVYQAVTNQAVYSGQTNTSTGNILVAQANESFTYDADGNLTSNSLWTNRWDGENRLLEMESMSGVPAGAKMKLVFQYDYQGRRISETVSNWTGSAWSLDRTRKFVYDGWNLIAELDGSNNVLQSYMWGSDLSGSMEGAGGVGGLLFVNDKDEGSHFVTYDGNGNVIALVNASDGEVSAVYEYGPFGEPIRATGTLAEVNPFRFSTKYQDDETGWLYYGHRFYNSSTGRWPNRDPLGEPGFELVRSVSKSKLARAQNLYGFVLINPLNNVDYLGLSSLPASFWAAMASGDLAMAALILEEMVDLGEATPAMQQALALAQRIAALLPQIAVNWQHAARCARLGALTVQQATQSVANTIANGGLTTWTQGGQTIFSGTFVQNGITYTFTGRINPQGLYEVGTIVQGIHRLAQ